MVGFLSSTGGFGTHTTITLFFPTRVHGMDGCTMMFSRMFPGGGENVIQAEDPALKLIFIFGDLKISNFVFCVYVLLTQLFR